MQVPILERSVTYEREIPIAGTEFVRAAVGKQRCIIRVGTLTVEGQRAVLSDGRHDCPVTVTKVETNRHFGSLGLTEANALGYPSVEGMRAALCARYGDLELDQPMSVLWFSRDDA